MGDDWLVNEEIKVDIQRLKDFAEAVRKELESNFQPSYENGLRPMLAERAPFGDGGLKEAAFFGERHEDSRMAVMQLMADVMRGLASLSGAARAISAEYADGDAMVKATHDDVFNAFTDVDGQQTLDGTWQHSGGGSGSQDRA
ncbi:hypothetical protein [Micromonospora endophytica]|uniref:Uncharacterized protein n=1 Tax=Micromonospora endophytica TaxID=515350 RepID=A0A2W2CFD5_9ACTN|nr:hypothetical protein [Micromonospora endophytica]PZF91654.1 hypothetical protein C1I93_21055 [Micromonospora endophytica]RIW40285.1 hypothetical protein D3H59_29490 [Micromonospora endophytica]BCJ59700.1 hypothetical protein Jiend_31220 [Micromonospora endophytica]